MSGWNNPLGGRGGRIACFAGRAGAPRLGQVYEYTLAVWSPDFAKRIQVDTSIRAEQGAHRGVFLGWRYYIITDTVGA